MMDAALIGPFKLLLLVAIVVGWYRWLGGKALINIQPFAVIPALGLLILCMLMAVGMYDKLMLLLLSCLVFLYPVIYRPQGKVTLTRLRRSVIFRLIKGEESMGSGKMLNLSYKGWSWPRPKYWVPALAVLVVFLSRYMMLHFDAYTLSELWLYNIGQIRALNDQSLVLLSDHVPVELLLVDLYHKLTGISEEMALHSFGLIENTVLALVLFRLTQKMSDSKHFLPFIMVILFALGFALLPMTASLLQEHNASYLACCFALPMIWMLWEKKEKVVLRSFLPAFVLTLATLIIHPFTAIIFLGIMLLPIMLIGKRHTFGHRLMGGLGWISALLTSLTTVLVYCYLMGFDSISVIKGVFISVDTYQYFPQLLLPWEELRVYYLYLAGFGFLLVAVNRALNGKTPYRSLNILLGISGFLLLEQAEIPWLDQALVTQGLSVLLVLLVGAVLGLIFQLIPSRSPSFHPGWSVALSFSLLLAIFYYSGALSLREKTNDPLKQEILATYNELGNSHLPYSYAVVNQSYGIEMSRNEHDFINYSKFLNNYISRDSLYHQYRGQEAFLREHPEYILPASVYVFISTGEKKNVESRLLTPSPWQKSLHATLEKLRARGRDVRSYYQGEHLQVIEIINEPSGSSINDLILGP